jgi:hypothetical protein
MCTAGVPDRSRHCQAASRLWATRWEIAHQEPNYFHPPRSFSVHRFVSAQRREWDGVRPSDQRHPPRGLKAGFLKNLGQISDNIQSAAGSDPLTT